MQRKIKAIKSVVPVSTHSYVVQIMLIAVLSYFRTEPTSLNHRNIRTEQVEIYRSRGSRRVVHGTMPNTASASWGHLVVFFASFLLLSKEMKGRKIMKIISISAIIYYHYSYF
jgi:hypothetical protein